MTLDFGRADTWKAFLAAISLWLYGSLADLASTIIVFRLSIPGVYESNAAIAVAIPHGIFAVCIAFLKLKLLLSGCVLLPFSLAAKAGSRSWLLASIPWWMYALSSLEATYNNFHIFLTFAGWRGMG